MYQLLESTNKIQIGQQTIKLPNPEQNNQIVSEGSVIWQLQPESKGGDWMFIGISLMPISDALFMAVQTYEHSRGANRIDIFEAYSTIDGRRLWILHLDGYDTKTYLFNEAKQQLCLFQSYPQNRPWGLYKGYIGTDLVCFELNNLKEIARYYVCYPEEKLSEQAVEGQKELMKLIKWSGFVAKFKKQDNNIGLEIGSTQFSAQKMGSLEPFFISIEDFLGNAPQDIAAAAAPPA